MCGSGEKDRNSRTLQLTGLGLLLIIISNITGHFFPPFSITVTPVLLPAIIGVVNYQFYHRNYIVTVAYGFVLLLFNDIFIRLYAGGTHDQVGKAWIMLFTSIAFIIAGGVMLVYAFTTTRQPKTRNILFNVLALSALAGMTVFVYMQFFADI